MQPGLPGGADRPPPAAAPESDFHAAYRRLRKLRSHYYSISRADIRSDYARVVIRLNTAILRKFTKFGGNTKELGLRPSGTTMADQAYDALHEMARQAERARDFGRAGEIREALGAIDKGAVEALQELTTKHGIPETPFIQAVQKPPAAAEPTMAVTAIPPPAHTPVQTDWFAAYRQLRDLTRKYSIAGQALAHADARWTIAGTAKYVAHRLTKFGGDAKRQLPYTSDATRTEQAYGAIQGMLRQAAESHDAARADQIRQALEDIRRYTTGQIDTLTRKYGALDTLSTRTTRTTRTTRITQATQAMLRPPASAGPPVTVASTTVPPPSQFDIPGPAHPIVALLNPAYTESTGGLVHATDVPGPCAVSGLPGPSHSETTGAEAGDLGRWRLHRPATVSGATAAQPPSTGNIVTPALGGTSSFWLQPVEGTAWGASHPVPPPPPSAAGRIGAGAGAPPPAADPWRIRPPGMGGEPHPVAFDPRSAPPGPSSQVVYTRAIRTPVVSAGTPPGWQGAGTSGFSRAASGAVELPFSRREEIALRFGTEDALLHAELTVRLGSADPLGWSATRRREVLDDLGWINTIVQLDSAAAAAGSDVDWRAIETLMRILDAPPPAP